MDTSPYSKEDLETALRISPLFYDAVLDQTRWPDALQAMAEFCGGERGASVQLYKLDTATLYSVYSYGMSESDEEYYLGFDEHLTGDPRLIEHMKRPNMPTHCRLLTTDEELHKSPIYQQVFKHINVEYALVSTILSEQYNYGFSIGVYRGQEQLAFDQSNLRRLDLLLPHLRRVGDTYIRLLNAESKFSQAEALLQNMNLAVLFTDKVGEVVFANKAAKKILDKQDGLRVRNNRLIHKSHHTTAEMMENIKKIAIADMTGQKVETHFQSIPRIQDDLPLQATYSSLSMENEIDFNSFTGKGYVAIYLTDPLQKYESNIEELQRVFGLTETEATVLSHIAVGYSIKEAAKLMDRAEETIRSHSKTLLSKMNANKQSDLVRMALNVKSPIIG